MTDTKGATAVEYSILVALIGLVVIGAITNIGSSSVLEYGNIAEHME